MKRQRFLRLKLKVTVGLEHAPPPGGVLGVRRGPVGGRLERARIDGRRALQNIARRALDAALVHPIHTQLDEIVPNLIRGDDRDARLTNLRLNLGRRVQKRRVGDDPKILRL